MQATNGSGYNTSRAVARTGSGASPPRNFPFPLDAVSYILYTPVMLIRQDENDKLTNDTTEAFQFEDLQQKADAYLANVKQQAQQIQQKTQSDLEAWREKAISNVKQETEALRKDAQTEYDQAYKKGYNDGFEKGLADAQANSESTLKMHLDERLDRAFPAIDAALDQLESQSQQWTAQWEAAGIQLALAIAEKILRSQIKLNPKKILPALREALELTVKAQKIRIRLAKEDYNVLLPDVKALTERFQRAGQTEIVPDDSLQSGDCLVETPMGEIDMIIRSQLDRIAEELI